MSLRSCSART